MWLDAIEISGHAHNARRTRIVVVDDDLGLRVRIDLGEVSTLGPVIPDVVQTKRLLGRAEQRRVARGAAGPRRIEARAQEHHCIPRSVELGTLQEAAVDDHNKTSRREPGLGRDPLIRAEVENRGAVPTVSGRSQWAEERVAERGEVICVFVVAVGRFPPPGGYR